METEISAALAALSGDNGWVVQVMSWMASARVVFKLFSTRLQALSERAMPYITNTESDEDDAIANKVLSSKAWRLFAFAVDMVASVKLPLRLP